MTIIVLARYSALGFWSAVPWFNQRNNATKRTCARKIFHPSFLQICATSRTLEIPEPVCLRTWTTKQPAAMAEQLAKQILHTHLSSHAPNIQPKPNAMTNHQNVLLINGLLVWQQICQNTPLTQYQLTPATQTWHPHSLDFSLSTSSHDIPAKSFRY